AFALRHEAGPTYDTYYSYFYDPEQRRWRLFGAGNKYHGGKPLQSLWVGSFVEVPGPPHVQRTGAYQRVMRYRGWIMDDQERWFPLDRISTGNVDRATGLTHTDRGVTNDGWFFLKTGGWRLRKASADRTISLPMGNEREEPIEYLRPDRVAALKTTPAAISATAQRVGREVEVAYRIHGQGAAPEVHVYWGTREALTFADRWDHHLVAPSPRDGENRVRLAVGESDSEGSGEDVLVRLLLKNAAGQFWTPATLRCEP
ncbi:MAG: DUF3472 domain-containing protein, partial [Planctomycetales bacterium]|nr:DUF3472 domain-containing protein [Planctomycetales bacterium]